MCLIYSYAECRYAECRGAISYGTHELKNPSKKFE
jgi:hypothetical protein